MPARLVVVGSSLGGLAALEGLLAALPSSFPLPVAVVQHRRSNTDELLASTLARVSRLPVVEVEDKTDVKAGRIFVAPSDYHLLVDAGRFALSTEARVNHARPSIDVLFESAADEIGAETIAVALTGASRDGAIGAARIKEKGGVVLCQDPATAESRILPEAVAPVATAVLSLPAISTYLERLAFTRR